MAFRKRLLIASAFLLGVTAAGSAAAAPVRDPCVVAVEGATGCKGENCVVDSNIALSGRWQRVGGCLRPYRGRWKDGGPSAQVDVGGSREPISDVIRSVVYRALVQGGGGAALQSDPTKYVPIKDVIGKDLRFSAPVVRIAQLNKLGVPYSSMSQTGFARILFGFSKIAGEGGYPQANDDRDRYLAISKAMVATVIAPVDKGGLASATPCDGAPGLTCRWFHAITRADKKADEGATLNKSLHAIRDMLLVDTAMAKAGLPPDPDYAAAIGDGLNQLFLSSGHTAVGRAPNMADFLVDREGDGPSWAYYGFNPQTQPGSKGYFLKSAKNCSYHNHVLDLMAVILDRSAEIKVAPEAREKALSCQSPLRRMYLASKMQLEKPSNAPAGVEWCTNRKGEAARSTQSFFDRAYASCGKPN